MVNGPDAVARLDNWFWTQSPPGLIGEICDDPPPRSWPDGASTRTSNVSELEQRGAAESKIIVTVTGRRYLLGKAATHASLAAANHVRRGPSSSLLVLLVHTQTYLVNVTWTPCRRGGELSAPRRLRCGLGAR